MKKTKITSLQWTSAFSLLLVAGIAGLLSADFSSQQVEVITMEAFVGGQAPENPLAFKIKHSPLRGVSLVTKLALIEGAVGTDLSAFGPAGIIRTRAQEPGQIRVKLRLQTFNADGTPSGAVDEKTATFFSDPAQFFFQISPSSLTAGGFQYQILAEQLTDQGVLLSTAAVPKDAFADPNLWIGVNSQANAAAIINPSGGRVTIFDANPNDGESMMDVPPGILAVPTQITLSEVPLNDSNIPSLNGQFEPFAMYKLDPEFKGMVRVSVIYPEFVPSASGWQLSGTRVPEEKLTLAIWDGHTWRNIGGKIDQLNKTITARSNTFGYLGVFAMGTPSGQSIADGVKRIITPNDDGTNDTADFIGIGASSIEIFDINGHRVQSLVGPNASWNGRDDSGKIVESGVYIYQFSENGERVSGVIGVAK